MHSVWRRTMFVENEEKEERNKENIRIPDRYYTGFERGLARR